jgi:hypothetical protein
MVLPLSGLTILEATGATAPPGVRLAIGLCGRVAAELGAQVSRWLPDGADEDETAHRFLHAGKRTLRAGGDAAPALLAELAGRADAVLIDPVLHASPAMRTPRRVCAVISMDATVDERQSEFTVEARAGLLDIVGDPAREPLRMAGHQCAYAAGLAAFAAIAAVLAERADTAALVRVSLLETAVWLNWKSLAAAEYTGRSPRRAGALGEWPVLPCADGYVAVVYRKQEWPRLRDLVPDPALREARFDSPEGRRAHRQDLNAILARFFATLTRGDIHALSLRHKMPFGAVWRPDELLADPQMLARDFFTATTGGAMPRAPVLWNGQRLVPPVADAADGVLAPFVS